MTDEMKFLMEVEAEMTRKDFKEFNQYVIKHKKIYKRAKLLYSALLVLLVILLNTNKITDISYMAGQVVLVLLIYFVVILLLKPISGLFIKYTPAKGGSVLGKHKFRISDEGLWSSIESGESLLKWKGIQSIETTKKYIFVFVDTHMAHVIPKRCFKSEEESKQFLDILESKAGTIIK